MATREVERTRAEYSTAVHADFGMKATLTVGGQRNQGTVSLVVGNDKIEGEEIDVDLADLVSALQELQELDRNA